MTKPKANTTEDVEPTAVAEQEPQQEPEQEPEAPTQPSPTIGRTVLVNVDPRDHNGASTAPAVITRVWTDTVVNVRVLGDTDQTPEWRTSLTLVDELEPGKNWCWAWPEHVDSHLEFFLRNMP